MNIKTGLVLPINYTLWPAKSPAILMAFVHAAEGDFLTLCPVVSDVKVADFFDLIVPASETSLDCDLVIMGKLQAVFPARALHEGINAARTDESITLCLAMPEKEQLKLSEDLAYVLKNTSPATAFKVLRGTFLPKESDAAVWRRKFVRRWQGFRLATLVATVKAQPDRFPQYLRVKTVFELVEQGQPRRQTAKDLPASANEENGLRIAANAKRHVGITIEKSETENLRKDLAKELKDQHLSDEGLQKLLDGNEADLLELALRIFPERD